MKTKPALLFLIIGSLTGLLFIGCSSPQSRETASVDVVAAPAPSGSKGMAADFKRVRESGAEVDYDAPGAYDDLDEYAVVEIPDPLEFINRPIFWLNDGIYLILVRPLAKGYEFLIPELIRDALRNVVTNVRYPIRVVNHTLQGRFDRTASETGKFLVNTTLGVGGIWKPSDKFPALADVPTADTGQTFAKWGVPHGFYIVLPVIGPKSLRDTVGYAGDIALNPLSYLGIIITGGELVGGPIWINAITGTDTVSGLPGQMEAYDTATENAVDKYIALRSSWVQLREAAKER